MNSNLWHMSRFRGNHGLVIACLLIGFLFSAFWMPSAKGGVESHYTILGLRPGATADEIKRAYRKAVQRLHPDRFPEGPERDKADETFRKITQAYRVLSDPEMRRAYDDLSESSENFFYEVRDSAKANSELQDFFAIYDSLHPRDEAFEERNSWMEIGSKLNVQDVGRKHSKPHWPWNEQTSEFMDLRTGWRSKWDGKLNFRVNKYVTFDPIKGTYVDQRMNAIFYPDINTWRRLDVATKKFRDVNPKNSLWLDAKEEDIADSSATQLFEKLLNPMNLEKQKRILQDSNKIQWTEALRVDFRQRAVRQLRSIPSSSGLDEVGVRIVDAIFGLPFAREFPELADLLFKEHPSLIWHFARGYLSKPEWLASPNAAQYLQMYIAGDNPKDVYWAGVFDDHKILTEAHNLPLKLMAENEWEEGIESFLFDAFKSKLNLAPVKKTLLELITTPAFLRVVISRDISSDTLGDFLRYLQRQGKGKYVDAVITSIDQVVRPWPSTRDFLRKNEEATQAILRIIEKELGLPRTETKAEKAARAKNAVKKLPGPGTNVSSKCGRYVDGPEK